jgi:hypothetical protein
LKATVSGRYRTTSSRVGAKVIVTRSPSPTSDKDGTGAGVGVGGISDGVEVVMISRMRVGVGVGWHATVSVASRRSPIRQRPPAL